MVEGQHYFEVELTCDGDFCNLSVGVVRPSLDHDAAHMCSSDAAASQDSYCLNLNDGSLCGNGNGFTSHAQGRFNDGDRIGCLLDLDAGWLRFYRDGVRCGPGFMAGVTGPLVRAVGMAHDATVTALPGAQAPAGAGDTDESWVQADMCGFYRGDGDY